MLASTLIELNIEFNERVNDIPKEYSYLRDEEN
jgi:hypothetical protein